MDIQESENGRFSERRRETKGGESVAVDDAVLLRGGAHDSSCVWNEVMMTTRCSRN